VPGQRLASVRVGDQAEYLTQFLLSHVAAVVPVPRQEDYGADFVCTLTKREGNRLRTGRPFLIQVKSGRADQPPPVRFGGQDNSDEQKDWETRWLFSQPLPLLLGFADVPSLTLKVYSTARMWWVRWMVCESPAEVRLAPNQQPNDGAPNPYDRYLHSHMTSPYRLTEIAAAEWTVPLGPPIAEVSADEVKKEGFIDAVYTSLEGWLWLDTLNVLWREQGVPVSLEYKRWEANHAPERGINNIEFIL